MTKTNPQKQFLTDDSVDVIEQLVDLKQLVVHNDNVNTFDWVIQALMEICQHTAEQAEQCSLIIHYKGKTSVKEGTFDELHPLKGGLADRGINATIE